MIFIHPTAGELYYLRLILANFPGFTCFEDVRTYNGVVHDNFKGTCLARGLLESDNEWHAC
jgi:hypothetical protein